MGWSKKRNRFYPSLSDEPEKFWGKVGQRSADECWPWLGCLSSAGYGRAGKKGYAHRLAYQLAVGPIPKGKFVCHRCDMPACCNPRHLFAGTQAENMQDAARKGRIKGGSPQKVDIHQARQLHNEGLSFREIGRTMGFSHGAIADAVRQP